MYWCGAVSGEADAAVLFWHSHNQLPYLQQDLKVSEMAQTALDIKIRILCFYSALSTFMNFIKVFLFFIVRLGAGPWHS